MRNVHVWQLADPVQLDFHHRGHQANHGIWIDRLRVAAAHARRAVFQVDGRDSVKGGAIDSNPRLSASTPKAISTPAAMSISIAPNKYP